MGKRGPQPGQGGRRVKPTAEKIAEGQRSHMPLKVVDFGEKTSELNEKKPDAAPDYLSSAQFDGSRLVGDEIYNDTCQWLADRGCLAMVSPQLIERYSMAQARWIQCENEISQTGFAKTNPNTGNQSRAVSVGIADQYLTQANRLWSDIYQIVRENCLTEYKGSTPHDDAMEMLLRSKHG